MRSPSPDPLASSDTELLILVDEDDNEVGHLSKRGCHDGEGLEEAVSRRLSEELRMRCAARYLYKFSYQNSS